MEISLPQSQPTLWNLRMTPVEITRMFGAEHKKDKRAEIKRDLTTGSITVRPTSIGGHKLTMPKAGSGNGQFALSRAQFGISGKAPTTQKLWATPAWNGQHATIIMPRRFLSNGKDEVSETDQLRAAVKIINKALAADPHISGVLDTTSAGTAKRLTLRRTVTEEIS